ncbi:hypothetical protein [Phenylobacterium sp.]|uniref:hypothetical protein n=1 Tax=Phenylobacterium sp. TaxID=1871053 RepID=UPI002FC8AC75
MTQFEFASVFASILYGLGIAHLFTNAIQQLYRKRLEFLQIAYAALTFQVMLVSWWGLFIFSDVETWTFEQFFVLVAQSVAFFGMCVALFPPVDDAVNTFESHRRPFLLLLSLSAVLDAVQAAQFGKLFSPFLYPLFIVQLPALALLAMWIRSHRFQIVVAVYLSLAVAFWAFLGRHVVG